MGASRRAWQISLRAHVAAVEGYRSACATSCHCVDASGDTPKAVLQLVYRTAGHALENWPGHLKDALQTATRLEVMPQLTLCSRLQVEYLERVIKPRQVFSVPIVTDVSALALLDTTALA